MKGTLSGRKYGSAYSQRKANPLIFGAKMMPYLWRADQSFSNSVTGSGSRAKCSNILQDIVFVLNCRIKNFFFNFRSRFRKRKVRKSERDDGWTSSDGEQEEKTRTDSDRRRKEKRRKSGGEESDRKSNSRKRSVKTSS